MTESSELRESQGIFDSLRNLEARLLRMVEVARTQTGRKPGEDPFRGLYVSETDVFRYLNDPEALVPANGIAQPLAAGPSFETLCKLFGLSRCELDTLLIALAAEIDPRYERIFAYLQDDVSRRRPSIDLILSLLCDSAAGKLDKRALFGASSPLMANRLIRLSGDELVPMARREVCLDARIVAFLLGDTDLDARLARFVRLVEAPAGRRPADAALVKIARRAAVQRLPLRVYFQGGDEEEKRDAATSLGAELGLGLLIADISRAARYAGDFDEWLHELAREAFLRQAIVYLESLDSLPDETLRETVLGALPAFRGIVIVSGAQELHAIQGAVIDP